MLFHLRSFLVRHIKNKYKSDNIIFSFLLQNLRPKIFLHVVMDFIHLLASRS